VDIFPKTKKENARLGKFAFLFVLGCMKEYNVYNGNVFLLGQC